MKSKDSIDIGKVKQIEQANNAFLPSYLGYFFVALSVSYFDTLVFVFLLLFVFTFLSQTLYFNPLFLIFRFHFYYLTTTNEIKIFIITKKELKDPLLTEFKDLRRINNFTFIDLKNPHIYDSDYNLDDDEWFAITEFSNSEYSIDFITRDFNSAEYNQIENNDYNNLKFLCSYQDDNFYFFQKLTNSQTVRKKWFRISNEPVL